MVFLNSIYPLPTVLVLGLLFQTSFIAASPTTKTKTSGSIENLVVFGDSFSDDGNGAWVLTNHTWPADPAYYGGRFSNGPIWAEYVAKALGWNLFDYAIGGATSNNTLVQGYTGPNSTIPVPSALDQLSQYISNSSAPRPEDTLFAVYIGANDAFFDSNVAADESMKAIKYIINNLTEAGASKFLLLSYPDLSRLPFDSYTTESYASFLAHYSTTLRSVLAQYADLASPSQSIGYVDVYNLFETFFLDPAHFGFNASVLTQSCLTGAYGETPTRTLCDDVSQYVFWDEYHPTTKSHGYVARLAEKVIRRLL